MVVDSMGLVAEWRVRFWLRSATSATEKAQYLRRHREGNRSETLRVATMTHRGSVGGPVQTFGELETVIMDRLWSFGRPVLVRDVLESLREERHIAYTTVLTVMDKLYKKGYLRREPAGRAHRYAAIASREAYTARLMRSALATSPNQAAAFVHFLSELSPQEAQALRAALDIVPAEKET
jgi:predicted transcriptional regulator